MSLRDSEGFYMAAITNNGAALQFCPESQKTLEVCMVAVQNDGNALEYVPRFLQTPEICLKSKDLSYYLVIDQRFGTVDK